MPAGVIARAGLRRDVDGERHESGLSGRQVELQPVGSVLEVHPGTGIRRFCTGLEQAEAAVFVVEGIGREHRERLGHRAGVAHEVVVGDLLARVGAVAEARAAVGVAVGASGLSRDADGVIGPGRRGVARDHGHEGDTAEQGDDEGPTDASGGTTGGGECWGGWLQSRAVHFAQAPRARRV